MIAANDKPIETDPIGNALIDGIARGVVNLAVYGASPLAAAGSAAAKVLPFLVIDSTPAPHAPGHGRVPH
ncbi:MAG: hypothetical protein J2P29_16745 [Actinobacteria bacterium]|nr:hypothetical protein [Actinomycetota bacterium]